ncbi:hypothetical protein [Amycolatopsis nigrescens]|uniref:hypothetical protein n=1 Tax=Amycolatopsis nigrescens TaxID=381445 RepID=UPI0004764E8A|nr:hypothetical protein [Amycolatopsis nigrescens]
MVEPVIESGPVVRPRAKPMVTLVGGSLVRWVLARFKGADRTGTAILHTADPQRAMIVFAAMEVLVTPLVGRLLPGVWQLVHLVVEVLVVGVYLGLAACWRIHPHLLDDRSLLLRTGTFGDVAIPLTAIEAVRRDERAAGGYGIRGVADEQETLACSVTSQTNVVIDLVRSYPFQAKDGVLSARHIRFSVNEPGDFTRLLGKALS